MKPLPQLPGTDAAHIDDLPSCLDRRAFIGNSTMLAIGALLASACGNGNIGGSLTGPGAVGVSVKISDYPALANVGGIARLSGTSTPIAVVKTTASTFRAFSMVCPHAGTVIAITGSGFLCPNHEARFSSTGTWLGGERTTNLKEFTVAADLTAGTLSITS